MLSIDNLHTRYGVISALKGVSLEVKKGQMVALIGPNGAGKTTLLNTLSGLIGAPSGSVHMEGQPLARLSAHEIARMGLLHVPEGRRILGPLSVQENLELGRLALGRREPSAGDDLDRVFSLFPILKERRAQSGGSLSGGQQQMLAIGRALMGRPCILLLDEPSLGLAPLVVQQVFDALQMLNREGLTILLVEQNARRALSVADHGYVIEQGRIVHSGLCAELASDDKVIRHYLGLEDEAHA
jgi:branched-chain amino acid transport system ATP-binding protein